MQGKKLQLENDLREQIAYINTSIPILICIDNLDDYFCREWSCHWHNEFEFEIVLEGTVEYTIYSGDKSIITHKLEKGDGIFITSGCLHSVKATKPHTVLCGFVIPINFFDMKLFENVYKDIVQPIIETGITNLFFSHLKEDDLTILSSVREICFITEQEKGYELHRIELICRIWRFLARRIMSNQQYAANSFENNCQKQRLKEMISFVHANFNKHINVDDIARSAAVSRTECYRCFQVVLRKTPSEYLTEYRLSTAAMLLLSTDKSISEIAYGCGFNSVSYRQILYIMKKCVTVTHFKIKTGQTAKLHTFGSVLPYQTKNVR